MLTAREMRGICYMDNYTFLVTWLGPIFLFYYSVCGNGFFHWMHRIFFYLRFFPFLSWTIEKNVKCHLIKTHMSSTFTIFFIRTSCMGWCIHALHSSAYDSNIIHSHLPNPWVATHSNVKREMAQDWSTLCTTFVRIFGACMLYSCKMLMHYDGLCVMRLMLIINNNNHLFLFSTWIP